MMFDRFSGRNADSQLERVRLVFFAILLDLLLYPSRAFDRGDGGYE